MELDGEDLRREPIEVRKANLKGLSRRARPGSLRVNGMLHVQGSPPIFPALDRGFCFTRYQFMTSEILGQRRFFNPSQAFIVKEAQAPNSFARCQALIVVDHDRDGITDCFTHARTTATSSCTVG